MINKPIFSTLLLLFTLIIPGCSKSDIAQQDLDQSTTVQIVKNGTLEFDKSVTVGNALDGYKYFGSTKWTSFQDSQKRTIVEFEAPYDYDKFVGTELEHIPLTADRIEKAKKKLGTMRFACVVQFAISTDGKTFQIASSSTKIFGTNKDTGKQEEEMHNDQDLQELLRVYKNQPSLSIVELLLKAGI